MCFGLIRLHSRVVCKKVLDSWPQMTALRAIKARLHGSPRLINTVESIKLNSTFERYCLLGSTKVNEAVDFKMAANELVWDGVLVICDYLIKERQHILEKRNRRKNDFARLSRG